MQDAITAATESIARPVAEYPGATAWVTAGHKGPGPRFYVLGSLGGNTFYGTLPQKPVERLRHYAAQARANAAKKPVPEHMKLHHMLMKMHQPQRSYAPVPGQRAQLQKFAPARPGTGEAAGLAGTSRATEAPNALAEGSGMGQGEALTGYHAVIAAAQTRAKRDAGRDAMLLPRLGGGFSGRSFAPIGRNGAANRFGPRAALREGGILDQFVATQATDGSGTPFSQTGTGHATPYATPSMLYPRPQPQPSGNSAAALHGPQHMPADPSPFALELALNDYFFRQSRLPPSGTTAFDPRLTPAWAGLKLPG